MSRKKRAQNLREAKDRRTKKIAIGGAVVLVAVLAFQVPKMMKSSSSSAPPAATTTAGTSTTPVGTTTPAGTAAAAVMPTAASTKLPNSDSQPRRAKSQLFSFSHFAGKDPFVQQVSDQPTGSASSGSSSSSSQPKAPSGQTTAAVTHKPSSRLLAAGGSVSLSVNGRIQVVRVGGSFPSANPLFKLVGVAHGVARIGLANGSYSSGAHTVSLVAGRTMTLVDTTDGIRYRIRLLAAA